ncbi:hypothetical protein [Leptospira ellinghausenii]|nr:hypothetical protein [Leptospira ellinghausenii]
MTDPNEVFSFPFVMELDDRIDRGYGAQPGRNRKQPIQVQNKAFEYYVTLRP